MLQSQAKEILQETEQSRALHRASCNFSKKPGQIYYLYKKPSGQNYFSMLSPEVFEYCLHMLHFINTQIL